MRIFKTGSLAKFTRQHGISDASLVAAERDNIDDDPLKTLREIVASWFAADQKKITQALNDGLLIEVQDGNENKKDPGTEG